MKQKILIALSGASGIGYAVHLLKELNKIKEIEVELIVSDYAEKIIELEEENTSLSELKKLASKVYDNSDLAAAPSSSSYLIDAMIVIPCSIKTAGEIANANCGTLISRTADNMLKMKKKLILCVRETPLSSPVLKNLYDLAMYGAIVLPLSPGFYHKPKELTDLKSFITSKILDVLGIENNFIKRWDSH
ncbi:MAG: UbiX family flavin prenyltransferase [Candidatus Diapherotrites archaeon]